MKRARRRMGGLMAFAGVAALVLAGCELLSGAIPQAPNRQAAPRYPEGCATKGIGRDRCDRIVAWARQDLAVADRVVVRVDFPDPDCGTGADGRPVLCTYGGAAPVIVRFTFADGSQAETSTPCGGIPDTSNPLCVDDPEIHLYGPTMGGGYWDTPEGASPVPSIDSAAADRAEALTLPARDIAITRPGRYEVDLGRATLPNGRLTAASFSIPDVHMDTIRVTSEGIRLEVRGEDGTPIWNVFDHGWHEGVEEVRVVLIFTVDSFEPGAVLQVRDVVVR